MRREFIKVTLAVSAYSAFLGALTGYRFDHWSGYCTAWAVATGLLWLLTCFVIAAAFAATHRL